MASLTYMQLLRGNRSFRRLWTGQVVSELGNWFNLIAVLGLVRAVSHAAPEATAILIVLRLAPFALFAPLAGAFVDRWSRRTVMIWADLARGVVALGFLLVRGPGDLWLAYLCMTVSTLLSAFFEAGKNASMPNVAGERGLLAGNALMFSSRFLLMAVGSALGGVASDLLGYNTAFVVNAASFVVSAYSVWLVPEREMQARGRDEAAREERDEPDDARRAAGRGGVWRPFVEVWRDVCDGWRYIVRHPLVAALIGTNVLWATGGGASNLLYERMGSVAYAGRGGLEGDAGVAFVFSALGTGLFLGMMLARRTGAHIELRGAGATANFIGCALTAHGLLFALAGLMPTLALATLVMFLSRVLVGVEYAVQDTLLMRLLPDRLRARVLTTDRASELLMMSLSSMVAGWLLAGTWTPRALVVFSGLLSATPGAVWLALFATGRLTLPASAVLAGESARDEGEAALASAS